MADHCLVHYEKTQMLCISNDAYLALNHGFNKNINSYIDASLHLSSVFHLNLFDNILTSTKFFIVR